MFNVKKTEDRVKLPTDYKLLEKDLNTSLSTAIEKIADIDFDCFTGSLANFISMELLETPQYFKDRKGKSREYEDYCLAFSVFYEIIKEINKYTIFTPTVLTFSRFMGISKATFDLHSNENNEKGEFVREILDFLSESLLQNMLSDKIPSIPAIYASKALYKLRDNDPQNVNILQLNTTEKTYEQIMEDYKKHQN